MTCASTSPAPCPDCQGTTYPAFHAAAESLRARGFAVESPVENRPPPCGTWEGWMRLAVAQLLRCDLIVLLPDWHLSRGALIEHRLARDLGMSVARLDELLAESV